MAGLATGVVLGAVGARALFRAKAPAPPEFQVLTYSGVDSQPSVSPDGKTIAFGSSRDGKNRIWVKQVAGGTEAVLTEGPDASPRFAPRPDGMDPGKAWAPNILSIPFSTMAMTLSGSTPLDNMVSAKRLRASIR